MYLNGRPISIEDASSVWASNIPVIVRNFPVYDSVYVVQHMDRDVYDQVDLHAW